MQLLPDNTTHNGGPAALWTSTNSSSSSSGGTAAIDGAQPPARDSGTHALCAAGRNYERRYKDAHRYQTRRCPGVFAETRSNPLDRCSKLVAEQRRLRQPEPFGRQRLLAQQQRLGTRGQHRRRWQHRSRQVDFYPALSRPRNPPDSRTQCPPHLARQRHLSSSYAGAATPRRPRRQGKQNQLALGQPHAQR